LHTLIFTAITRLNESKATAHDCVAAYFIDHLGFNLLLELYPKMVKHPGEQEPISKIMRSEGVCDPSYVSDHEGRQVNLFSIHQIS